MSTGEPSAKHFGAVAINEGFVTIDQFIEAMRIQVKEDMEKAEHRLIGEILSELGLMTASQIKDVLVSLDRTKP
ncbi:hypothetical protein ACFL9T_08400 [Thermodesulfobacteriota bacterium]